jgi:hypothetical protein
MSVDRQAATDRLMRFLAVEGVTGKEVAIGRELTAALEESGVPRDAIRLDDANTRIPVPTETGNCRSARARRDAQPAAGYIHDPHGHRPAVRRSEAEACRP